MNEGQVALFILLLADSLAHFQCFAVINPVAMSCPLFVCQCLSAPISSFSSEPFLGLCPDKVTNLVKRVGTGVQMSSRAITHMTGQRREMVPGGGGRARLLGLGRTRRWLHGGVGIGTDLCLCGFIVCPLRFWTLG